MDVSSASNSESNEVVLLQMLERVLTVFTTDLISLIDSVLAAVYKRLTNETFELSTIPSEVTAASNLSEHDIDIAVAHHFSVYPDKSIVECPDRGLVSYRYHAKDACKVILESLLVQSEPISAGFLSSIFSDMSSSSVSTSTTKTVTNVIRMFTEVLCIVSKNTLQYRKKAPQQSIFGPISDVNYNESHSLTPEEKEMVIRGLNKCSKFSVMYRGDQIDRPLTTMEWRHLAKLLINLSHTTNTKCGFTHDPSTVFNTWKDVLFACRANFKSTHQILDTWQIFALLTSVYFYCCVCFSGQI
jgi:hypothetical protein